jgi:outer membrane protein assembly factor BamB
MNPGSIPHWRLVPSPISSPGIVLTCGPKGAPAFAVRPGTGTLGNDSLAWQSGDDRRDIGSDVPTPAFYDGDFFILNDLRGSLWRVDPATGKVKWTIKTPGRAKYEASPTAADGKLYLINHDGEAAVIDAATGKVEKVIPMDNPANREAVRASIVAAQGHLFIRTTRQLLCVGGQ